ncbi:sigma-70 family RNA polymerase sigma factor [Streptomyces sp. NPDC028635]|uniref:RNA polymerase sigma factor n=1 Tax=Streptomyces sp. NPDC028635 TaxID=3154800 RepID=UPI0033DC7A14
MDIGDHFEDSQEDEAHQGPHPPDESAEPAATPDLNSGREEATLAAEAISPEARADFVRHCEENTGRLIGAAYRVTGNLWDAQDAVQTVWYRFWKSWPSADFRNVVLNNPGYSYRAVFNAALDIARSEMTRTLRQEKEARKESVTEDGYSRVEDDARLFKLLKNLHPTWRLVIHLRFTQELTFAELAAVLRVSEATARRYEKRAIKALEEAYKEK